MLSLCFCVFFLHGASGQQIDPLVDDPPWTEPSGPPPPPTPIQVIAPTQELRPYERIMYVLDVSCSMRGELPDAISATSVFCSDGFKAAVVTYASGFGRWVGVKESCNHPPSEPCSKRCPEDGWIQMPKQQKEFYEYLNSLDASGGTVPGPALEYAIRNVPADTLIVFISDGDFRTENAIPEARAALDWRRDSNIAPVQILVWSTNAEAQKQEALVELANLGGGGLWRAETPLHIKPPDESWRLRPW